MPRQWPKPRDVKQLTQGTSEVFCTKPELLTHCWQGKRKLQGNWISRDKSTSGPLNAALDVLMDSKFPFSSKGKFVFRGSKWVTCSYPCEKSDFLCCSNTWKARCFVSYIYEPAICKCMILLQKEKKKNENYGMIVPPHSASKFLLNHS